MATTEMPSIIFRLFLILFTAAMIILGGCGDTKLFDEDGEEGTTTTLSGATTTTTSATTTTTTLKALQRPPYRVLPQKTTVRRPGSLAPPAERR